MGLTGRAGVGAVAGVSAILLVAAAWGDEPITCAMSTGRQVMRMEGTRLGATNVVENTRTNLALIKGAQAPRSVAQPVQAAPARIAAGMPKNRRVAAIHD